MSKHLVVVVPLLALAACTSSKSPGSVTGSIRGDSYPVSASISATMTAAGINGTRTAVIVLSSAEDVCQSSDARVQHPGQTTVSILLFDGNAAPSKPGTFPIIDPNNPEPPDVRAVLSTSILDSACQGDAEHQTAAVSGSVALTLVGGGVYIGNFDVMLDSGDHITGSFNPSLCEDLPAQFKDPGTPACKP